MSDRSKEGSGGTRAGSSAPLAPAAAPAADDSLEDDQLGVCDGLPGARLYAGPRASAPSDRVRLV